MSCRTEGFRNGPLRLAFFAGESSGDIQGARLLEEMRARRPGIEAWGIGGAAMARAGVELLYDSGRWGAIGLVEGIRVGVRILPALYRCKRALAARRPDLVVLIDFGAFNKHLARHARRLGLRSLWYFPPGSWKRRARVSEELRRVDRVVTPFPWSAELLRAAGMDAHFVGHPLLDTTLPRLERAAVRAQHGLDPKAPLVAWFPGSRLAELDHIWPPMAEAARRLTAAHPEVQHAVGVAASLAGRAEVFRNAGLPRLVTTGDVHELLNACDYVVTKSGTISLETAIFQRPMVIVYRVSRLTMLEVRLLFGNRPPWVGLPNILAEEGICPELLAEAATGQAMADQVSEWIRNPESATPQRQALARLREQLGKPGGAGRAAELALDLASSTG